MVQSRISILEITIVVVGSGYREALPESRSVYGVGITLVFREYLPAVFGCGSQKTSGTDDSHRWPVPDGWMGHAVWRQLTSEEGTRIDVVD